MSEKKVRKLMGLLNFIFGNNDEEDWDYGEEETARPTDRGYDGEYWPEGGDGYEGNTEYQEYDPTTSTEDIMVEYEPKTFWERLTGQ